MMERSQIQLCPENKVSLLIAVIGKDEARAMRDLDVLLRDYSGDPRLHFLKGSLLASRKEYDVACSSMRHAVDLAPDYGIARFQLGFLLLTSGKAHAAQEAWGPLYSLPADNCLRLFVTGLSHLIHDEFDDAVHRLQEGIARNRENPPMNRDMQLIIDEVQGRQNRKERGGATSSSVDMLLQQAALKGTRH